MDAVIATSARRPISSAPATVILHGVDTERLSSAAGSRGRVRGHGLPGQYAIGCFGRVRAQKGTDVFVEAMCALLPKYPDFTAVIIGAVDGSAGFATALKSRSRPPGLPSRIVFWARLPIDDVPPWYQRILIYAFTSRNEGFGLTLLEAMASGAALVAARAGAAETVVADGETGVLVPPGDAAALTEALEPLMRDPARGRRWARRRARVSLEVQHRCGGEAIVAVYRAL